MVKIRYGRLLSLPLALPLAAALVVAHPSTAQAKSFAIAEDRHTPNEITFTSRAPLVRMVGRTSKVSGVADIDLQDITRSTGRFEVPLATLETGIKLRDEHMRDTLDTERFPTAQFVVRKVSARSPKVVPEQPHEVDVDGTLTIRGVTREIRVPATVVYYPENKDVRGPGDWVMLSTSFKIKLTDYGIPLGPKVLGPKVADEIVLAIDAMARSAESGAGR